MHRTSNPLKTDHTWTIFMRRMLSICIVLLTASGCYSIYQPPKVGSDELATVRTGRNLDISQVDGIMTAGCGAIIKGWPHEVRVSAGMRIFHVGYSYTSGGYNGKIYTIHNNCLLIFEAKPAGLYLIEYGPSAASGYKLNALSVKDGHTDEHIAFAISDD